MLQQVVKFVRDEEGATAVEYGLIIGLIAIALVTVLVAMAGGLSDLFDKAKTCLTTSTC
jgi:pilus assembly protein Flp/PilA